ncbi:MAG: PEP-CTERM sorting domain-containing protein [Armatimonadetes bacterium]|nr:PEP-CTERM sorting domain-containing protein [Armatimonadota bacterium]
MNTKYKLVAMVATVIGVSSAVNASIIFGFAGNSGVNSQALSATAKFTVSGTSLTIELTNTATQAANDGANVLDGLYFDIAGSPSFAASNGNAALKAGEILVKKNAPNTAVSGNALNNEWMFGTGKTLPAFTASYGIGCTGYKDFNPNNHSFDKLFHAGSGTAGANDDYGIVPTLGITVGNGSQPYARRAMVFTFVLPTTISESAIVAKGVSYGSNGQTVLPAIVPEPGSMVALALGSIVLIRRRR